MSYSFIYFRMTVLYHRHILRMTCLDVFVEGQAVHLVMPYMDTDLKKVIEDRVGMWRRYLGIICAWGIYIASKFT